MKKHDNVINVIDSGYDVARVIHNKIIHFTGVRNGYIDNPNSANYDINSLIDCLIEMVGKTHLEKISSNAIESNKAKAKCLDILSNAGITDIEMNSVIYQAMLLVKDRLQEIFLRYRPSWSTDWTAELMASSTDFNILVCFYR